MISDIDIKCNIVVIDQAEKKIRPDKSEQSEGRTDDKARLHAISAGTVQAVSFDHVAFDPIFQSNVAGM